MRTDFAIASRPVSARIVATTSAAVPAAPVNADSSAKTPGVKRPMTLVRARIVDPTVAVARAAPAPAAKVVHGMGSARAVRRNVPARSAAAMVAAAVVANVLWAKAAPTVFARVGPLVGRLAMSAAATAIASLPPTVLA